MFWMLIFTDAPLYFSHMWKKRWFRVFFWLSALSMVATIYRR
jgi:hypothetical protein